MQLNIIALFADLIISYSYWFILLAIVTGLLYAGLLYFRNPSNKLSTFWSYILFIIRFIAVSLLSFLLLSPYYKTREKVIEKPIVVIGYDNSNSLVLGTDSNYYKTDFPARLNSLTSALSSKYRTETYTFGSEVRKSDFPQYTETTSDYSSFITFIKNEFIGKNIGAVVLAGDGIYNKGTDPVFAASGISIPIYTVALGDTNAMKDIKITDVRYNSLVYKDDTFPVEVSLQADMLQGQQAEIVITAFGNQQVKKMVLIDNDDFSATYAFKLEAKKMGKHHINVDVFLKEEELNKSNNHFSIFMDVIDNAQKILILAKSPHPDISAIYQSLKSYDQYETEIVFLDEANSLKYEDYDLLILHQIPHALKQESTIQATIMQLEMPVLYILGKQSSLPAFNQQFKGMDILTSIGKFEEARPDVNTLFTGFSYKDTDIASIESLPPLISPLGNYMVSPNTEIFAYQRIKGISTDFPLVAFYDESDKKSGVIIGEGIWMWRIHNYLYEGNFDAFDQLISKSVQYLVAKRDKRFFKVITKNTYNQSDNVILTAELYNAAYEAVNTSEVSLQLTDETGQQFNYLFSPKGDFYTLDLRQLDMGIYKYVAQTQYGNDKYDSRGEFIVKGQSFESRVLKADHHLLYRLANATNGKLFYPQDLDNLPDLFANDPALKNRIYFEEKISGINTLPIVLIIILFLLSIEWFVRKYFGSY